MREKRIAILLVLALAVSLSFTGCKGCNEENKHANTVYDTAQDGSQDDSDSPIKENTQPCSKNHKYIIINLTSGEETEHDDITDLVTNNKYKTTHLVMRYIPPGEFQVGANDGISGEKPVHKVKITKAFYMQATEVTQGQWKVLMGNNPSHFKGDDLPVEQVSWNDIHEFIEKINAKVGINKYCLPTEAEWEYACRAGSKGKYCFGDNASMLGEYAWYKKNSDNKTHSVGIKKPNNWGLYDMHGNVLEWCADWYYEDYYENSPTDDPKGPASGSERVLRGGSWFYIGFCQSDDRIWSNPDDRNYYVGFRLSRSAP